MQDRNGTFVWHSSEGTSPSGRAGHFVEPEFKLPADFPTRQVILGFRHLDEVEPGAGLPAPAEPVIRLALDLLQAAYSIAQRVRIKVDHATEQLEIVGAKSDRPPMLTSAYSGEDGGILLLVEFGDHEIEVRVEPDLSITLTHTHGDADMIYAEGMTETEATTAIATAWDMFLCNLFGSSGTTTSILSRIALFPRLSRTTEEPARLTVDSPLWSGSVSSGWENRSALTWVSTTQGSAATVRHSSSGLTVRSSLPVTA